MHGYLQMMPRFLLRGHVSILNFKQAVCQMFSLNFTPLNIDALGPTYDKMFWHIVYLKFITKASVVLIRWMQLCKMII